MRVVIILSIVICVVLSKWLNSQYKVITSDITVFNILHAYAFSPSVDILYVYTVSPSVGILHVYTLSPYWYFTCSHFQPLCPPRSSKPRVGGSQVRDFPKNHQFLLEDLIEITLWYFICESRGILWFYRIQVRPLPCLVCKSVSPCSLLELIHGFVKVYVRIFHQLFKLLHVFLTLWQTS